jgi:hypothetical protein
MYDIIMYDIIIIGGGISSLYAAYKVLQTKPDLSILLLEKNNHLGGRTWKEEFCNKSVVVGAGVLRAKDKRAIKLLNELNISYSIHKKKTYYILPFNHDIDKIFIQLKKEYNDNPDKYIKYTFKKFGESIIGKKIYNECKIQSGFSDFDNQNVYDTLYNYDFDDNFTKSNVIYVDWTLLINGLKNKLKSFRNFNLQTNINVKKIDYNDIITVFTNKTNYECKKIISGTNITDFLKIFRDLPKKSLVPYNKIQGQPFLLLYAKFSKDSARIMEKHIEGFTICNSILQKIIPIDSKDGIYIISYSDNKNALLLKPHVNDKKFIADLVEKTLNIDSKIEILKLRNYFWENGTHYYKPYQHLYSTDEFYKKITNPIINNSAKMNNVHIVGEMVCQKQGWVEGTLETIDNCLDSILR